MKLNRTGLLSIVSVIIIIAIFLSFSGSGVPKFVDQESIEITPTLRMELPKDAIPPLFYPLYNTADEASWVKPDDLIIGFEHNGEARAFPILILNWHEIVNDNIGGKEIVISFCPLCGSGIVFDREVDGRILYFGNSGGLYESSLVMYDNETGSLWWQVGGEAVQGPLKGKTLQRLHSVISEWAEWLELYPETLVLSRDTGYLINYEADPYAGSNSPNSAPGRPVTKLDERLPPKEIVVGVSINGEAKAYPKSRLGDSVIMDEVGGTQLVVFSKESSSYLAVFKPQFEDTQLEFFMENGKIIDKETRSTWNTAGTAIDGSLIGKRLIKIPISTEFWFAWALDHPDTEIQGIDNN